MKDEDLKTEELLPEMDEEAPEQGDARQAIPPVVLKMAVAAYLIWVIQEIAAGILNGRIMGRSAILLAAACVVLFGGAAWLIASEWVCHRKKLHSRQPASENHTESF